VWSGVLDWTAACTLHRVCTYGPAHQITWHRSNRQRRLKKLRMDGQTDNRSSIKSMMTFFRAAMMSAPRKWNSLPRRVQMPENIYTDTRLEKSNPSSQCLPSRSLLYVLSALFPTASESSCGAFSRSWTTFLALHEHP
jgi:hypothetical protein